MNEFTKVELLKLYEWAMSLCDEFPLSFDKSDIDLYKKIESMIENHCEHEWKKGEHLILDIYCLKCAKVLK